MVNNEMFDVLQVLRRKKLCDKTFIANTLNTSRTTISRILSEMEEENIICINSTIDSGEYSDSRKSAISLLPEYGHMLGIAVGTRHIRAVLLDMNYTPIKTNDIESAEQFKNTISYIMEANNGRIEEDTLVFNYKEYSLEEVIFQINLLVEDAITYHSGESKIIGIGIAFPGIVSKTNNQIISCPNFPALNGKQVSDIIFDKHLSVLEARRICVVIDDTAKGALVSEREHLYTSTNISRKSLASKPNIGVVYMGTGISFAVSFGGRLIRGASNCCGELGHVQVPQVPTSLNGPSLPPSDLGCYDDANLKMKISAIDYKCTCGRSNCLEAMMRNNVFDSSSLEEYWKNTSQNSLKVFRNNNPEGYNNFKFYIGYIMNLLINMLNLDALIFTGRLFTCVPEIKDELNTIKGINTLSYSGSACSVIVGEEIKNTVAQGMAMQACAHYFGANDITWKPIF